jgi:hypothetical protein
MRRWVGTEEKGPSLGNLQNNLYYESNIRANVRPDSITYCRQRTQDLGPSGRKMVSELNPMLRRLRDQGKAAPTAHVACTKVEKESCWRVRDVRGNIGQYSNLHHPVYLGCRQNYLYLNLRIDRCDDSAVGSRPMWSDFAGEDQYVDQVGLGQTTHVRHY